MLVGEPKVKLDSAKLQLYDDILTILPCSSVYVRATELLHVKIQSITMVYLQASVTCITQQLQCDIIYTLKIDTPQ